MSRATRAAHAAKQTTEASEDPPMKIRYDSIRLEFEIHRFADKGYASSQTSQFNSDDGVRIEHDTAARVVRISKGALVRNIPECRVLWFGDEYAEPVKREADRLTEAASAALHPSP